MLNFVCEPDGTAAAVLVGALQPTRGIDAMRRRRGREELRALCSGPGKLTEALAIPLSMNGRSLTRPPFELYEPSAQWRGVEVAAGPRIGITKATDLPWRFVA